MRRLAATLLLAGCSAAPASEEPRDFESLWKRACEAHPADRRSRLFCVPWSSHCGSLADLAGGDRATFDLLFSRLLEEPSIAPCVFAMASAPSCALGESHSIELVERLSGSADKTRRAILLSAIDWHANHAHRVEEHGWHYSVPARVEKVLSDSVDVDERRALVRLLLAYFTRYREARNALWDRLAGEHAFDPDVDDVVEGLLFLARDGPDSVRFEIVSGLRHYLLAAIPAPDPQAPGRLARYHLRHDWDFSAEHAAAFANALEKVARKASSADYRWDAAEGLCTLDAGRGARAIVGIIKDRPAAGGVSRAVYTASHNPSALKALADAAPGGELRAAAIREWGRRVIFWKDKERADAVARLMRWLRDDAEEVRAAALERLCAEIYDLVMEEQITFAGLESRAGELLDIVLRDPSVRVRRVAVDELRKHEEFADHLPSALRAKVEALLRSVE